MDARLERYYKKKLYGGRSMVARMVDFIVFRAFLLFILFIMLLYWSRSLSVALPVSILLTVSVSLIIEAYKKKKTEKFLKKDMKRILEKCLLENLTLMGIHEYADYIGRLLPGMEDFQFDGESFTADRQGAKWFFLHNHPSCTCGVSDVLNAFRACKGADKIRIVALSGFSEDAKKLAEGLNLRLISGKDILKVAAEKEMMPDERVAEEKAKQEMESTVVTLERAKRSALSRSKLKGYVACGVIIMIWPLFGGFKFYYPVIAAVCFVLAFLSYRKGKQTQESADIDAT